jgi:hypothetical protein
MDEGRCAKEGLRRRRRGLRVRMRGGAELRTRGVGAAEHDSRSVDAYNSVLRSSIDRGV